MLRGTQKGLTPMLSRWDKTKTVVLALVAVQLLGGTRKALAASCTTQAQMPSAQRDAVSNAAKTMLAEMRDGNIQSLQANTLPAVASDFSGIASSVQNLRPLLQNATLTVENLYVFDSSGSTAASTPSSFFCGQPLVILNFSDLPPGTYALAIGHATGVPQPQQISIILAKSSQDKWLLGGLFIKPMLLEGHDGIWYWNAARNYAGRNGTWGAWFYYRIATNLLTPIDSLSSPNLEKLQREAEKTKPAALPGAIPVTVTAANGTYSVSAVDTTTTFGVLDLDVHYIPDAAQTSELRNPPEARKQVIDVMSALLAQHPELHQAFHGMWVHADQGNTSLFALELPMSGITPGSETSSAPR
jgi:hypothetical protein